jgi:hypothetical protein
MLAFHGPGPLSIDEMRRRLQHKEHVPAVQTEQFCGREQSVLFEIDL